MLKVYTLANCDSCRSAVKWLRSQGIAFDEVAIRETPPSLPELRAALAANGGELRTLFNTAGRDYREQGLSGKLGTMKVGEALALLASNGNLVKRPFVTGPGVALTGFSADRWKTALRAG